MPVCNVYMTVCVCVYMTVCVCVCVCAHVSFRAGGGVCVRACELG